MPRERTFKPEEGLLKEHLRLEKEATAQGETRWVIQPLNRELSFDKGFYVFIRALQLLSRHNNGCTIVGLAGASGSGKTTFSQRVKSTMSGVTILSMDMYNDGTKVRENNFDDPRLADYDLLLENLRDLRAGRSCQAPVYDFRESRRTGYETVSVPESRIVIVEGIYALSSRLAPLLDLRVAITGGIHFDLVKRVIRDINRSGQEANEIIQQISDTVYPMYKVYIEPDLKSAHIKIYNNFNPFAGFKDPVYIIKTGESFTKDAVQRVLADMGNADTSAILEEPETEAYDIFLLPPGEDIQECQSWLRMRNKEGRYTLMFAEWFVNEPFIISPRISFEVPVKLLGGLMALGYTIGSIMSRKSVRMKGCTGVRGDISVKWDRVEKLGCFMQIQGSDRDTVKHVADKLGVASFVPRSYIEQVQLLKLTEDFREVNEETRRRFAFDDDSIIDDHVIGGSHAQPLAIPNRPDSQPRAPRLSDIGALSSSLPVHRHVPSDARAYAPDNRRRGSADGNRPSARSLLSQQVQEAGFAQGAKGAFQSDTWQAESVDRSLPSTLPDMLASEDPSPDSAEVSLHAEGITESSNKNQLPSFWRDRERKAETRTPVEEANLAVRTLQQPLDQLHRDLQALTSAIKDAQLGHSARHRDVQLPAVALTGCALGVALGCGITVALLASRTPCQ